MAHHLFPRLLWSLFLLVTGVTALVWISGFGDEQMLAWSRGWLQLPPPTYGGAATTKLTAVQETLLASLVWLDVLWVMLAAAHAYLLTTMREGVDVARRWAGLILPVLVTVLWFNALTGWPLGPLHYTSRFGPKLGPVPIALPLLWLAVVLGARDLVLRVRPTIGQIPLALASGVLMFLFDCALEPLAWKARAFWLWYPTLLTWPEWSPVRNFASWFVVGTSLVYLLREGRAVSRPQPFRSSAAAVYLLLLAVVASAAIARA